MNGFPDCDDMGLAKEHKLQQEIDAEELGRFTEKEIDRADYMHDEIRDRMVEKAFRKLP
jgi:hypothetical protein